MKHMKYTYKTLMTVGLISGLLACDDTKYPNPNLVKPAGIYSANFLFVNASPDAPTLSFFVNNDKIGGDAASDTPGGYAQTAYTNVTLTSPGFTGALTSNSNIRARAASGSIGGALGTNDLIFRAGNTNVTNFTCISGNNYTVFVVDSTTRPAPLRTYNAANFGDITYYNPKTGAQISIVDKANITDPVEAGNLVTIGLVPLGASDPGGPRFYIAQDAFPTIATPTTQAGIRFVNAVPNANNTPGQPSLFVRLRPGAGANISLSAGTTHVTNSASLNPSVGSRTSVTTPPAVPAAGFTLQVIAAASVPINYTLEASISPTYATIAYSAAVSFVPNHNYTVFMRGLVGKSGGKGLSHGIITHN